MFLWDDDDISVCKKQDNIWKWNVQFKYFDKKGNLTNLSDLTDIEFELYELLQLLFKGKNSQYTMNLVIWNLVVEKKLLVTWLPALWGLVPG